VLERFGSQAVQPTPSIPQLENPDWTQVFPWQQPLGHDVELHTHFEPRQTWPALHCGLPPQLQAPPDEQLSDLAMSHEEQAPPPAPQVPRDGVSHVAPTQHPLAHVSEQPSQTLLTQFALLGHVLQSEPPVPHAPGLLPCWHWLLLSQQPFGHDVPLQTHAPPEQICPGWHCASPLQVHAPPVHPSAVAPHAVHLPPPVPQVDVFSGSQTLPLQHPEGHDLASQTHPPFTHSCPGPHAAPAPHEHDPPAQPSDLVASHAEHCPPADPHWACVTVVTHFPWLQQPEGHDVGSQMQTPLTQC
jgi:hypothetical protein